MGPWKFYWHSMRSIFSSYLVRGRYSGPHTNTGFELNYFPEAFKSSEQIVTTNNEAFQCLSLVPYDLK